MATLQHAADGHAILGGARWHVPKMNSPTECSISGCDRVLGQRAAESSEDEEGAA